MKKELYELVSEAEIKVRDKMEIQCAHDILTAIVAGEIEIEIDDERRKLLSVASDVLCWVLQHDNPVFQKVLDAAEAVVMAHGATVVSGQ